MIRMIRKPSRPFSLSKKNTASSSRGGSNRLAAVGLLCALALMVWMGAGCALTAPLHVESKYAPETPPGPGAEVVIEMPLDARHFTTSDLSLIHI